MPKRNSNEEDFALVIYADGPHPRESKEEWGVWAQVVSGTMHLGSKAYLRDSASIQEIHVRRIYPGNGDMWQEVSSAKRGSHVFVCFDEFDRSRHLLYHGSIIQSGPDAAERSGRATCKARDCYMGVESDVGLCRVHHQLFMTGTKFALDPGETLQWPEAKREDSGCVCCGRPIKPTGEKHIRCPLCRVLTGASVFFAIYVLLGATLWFVSPDARFPAVLATVAFSCTACCLAALATARTRFKGPTYMWKHYPRQATYYGVGFAPILLAAFLLWHLRVPFLVAYGHLGETMFRDFGKDKLDPPGWVSKLAIASILLDMLTMAAYVAAPFALVGFLIYIYFECLVPGLVQLVGLKEFTKDRAW